MIEKVRAYIEKYNMIEQGDTIVLGISGGADSVCLFFVLLELRKYYDITIIAVHVNHNLRGADARRDQAYVEEICELQQVECIVIDADIREESKRRKRSLEEAGREVRREAFAKVAQDRVAKIATAHHQNDHVETMMLNLARGTGIGGLTGIAPVRDCWIRPLLCVQREEIEKYLEVHEIKYCVDETNFERIYSRNIIRHDVVAVLEQRVNAQVVEHIDATIEELTKIEMYLQTQVEKSWNTCVKQEKTGIMILRDALQELPQIIQEKILKKALEQVAGYQRDLARIHVESLMALLEKQVGREVHLPYDVIGKRCYQGVLLEQIRKNESEEALEKEELLENVVTCNILERSQMGQIKDTPYTKYYDYDIIKKMPIVRTRQAGDQIVIHRNGNRQTIKKYYITNKIPEKQRGKIHLVTTESEVLWIVGHRKSSGYEVTEQTKNVLEVRYNGGNYVRDN